MQCNDIISIIVFTRMFFMLFSNRMISFFTLQCELFPSCNVSNNASIVSTRTVGRGRGWSTKCGQIWTGGGGVPKIPKFVQTSFMDDPLWNLENVVRCFFWIQNSNFSKNLSKSSPISCYFLTYFSLKTQNQISTCHFDLDRVDKIISRAENLSFFPIAFNKVH